MGSEIKSTSTLGKVVRRYNISKAKIERYFIPSENIEAYEKAKSRQDLTAYSTYGTQLQVK